MREYFKGRVKSYIFLIIGLLIGFFIARITIETPDYKAGIIVVSIGLIIGELFIFITWVKNRNNSQFHN